MTAIVLPDSPMGRDRYFRLASERVADALEAVSLLSAPKRPRAPSVARLTLARVATAAGPSS